MKHRLSKLMSTLVASAVIVLMPLAAVGETTIKPLVQTILEDLNGSEASVLVLDVDPGWDSGLHTHSGHVFIYVLEGTLQLDIVGQEPFELTAGDARYEVRDAAMVGRNFSTSERAKFVVFNVGPPGAPLMIPVPE